MTDAQGLTSQFNLFQSTFDNINGMINDPAKGLKHPETLMAVKVGLQNVLNIRLPNIAAKGVNAYFISNLVAKGVNGGKGLDDPETRNNVMGKVSGFMAGIESSFGLKQGTLTGFIESLFGEAKAELAKDETQTLADAKAAEEKLKPKVDDLQTEFSAVQQVAEQNKDKPAGQKFLVQVGDVKLEVDTPERAIEMTRDLMLLRKDLEEKASQKGVSDNATLPDMGSDKSQKQGGGRGRGGAPNKRSGPPTAETPAVAAAT
jgi:hypothetical protein